MTNVCETSDLGLHDLSEFEEVFDELGEISLEEFWSGTSVSERVSITVAWELRIRCLSTQSWSHHSREVLQIAAEQKEAKIESIPPRLRRELETFLNQDCYLGHEDVVPSVLNWIMTR